MTALQKVFDGKETRMKKYLVQLLFLGLPAISLADSWAIPQIEDYYNADSSFYVRVFPTSITPCYAKLFKVTDDGDSLVWNRSLVNAVSPTDAVISGNGDYMVTFNNWSSLGYGDNVMVCYDRKGDMIRKYSLEDISPFPIEEYLRSVSSIWWLCGARFIGSDSLAVCFRNENGERIEKFYLPASQSLSAEPRVENSNAR